MQKFSHLDWWKEKAVFFGRDYINLGKMTVKVDPFPTSLSTVMVPPWPLTISDTM